MNNGHGWQKSVHQIMRGKWERVVLGSDDTYMIHAYVYAWFLGLLMCKMHYCSIIFSISTLRYRKSCRTGTFVRVFQQIHLPILQLMKKEEIGTIRWSPFSLPLVWLLDWEASGDSPHWHTITVEVSYTLSWTRRITRESRAFFQARFCCHTLYACCYLACLCCILKW